MKTATNTPAKSDRLTIEEHKAKSDKAWKKLNYSVSWIVLLSTQERQFGVAYGADGSLREIEYCEFNISNEKITLREALSKLARLSIVEGEVSVDIWYSTSARERLYLALCDALPAQLKAV